MSRGGSNDAAELPGFYFDAEKNRYFKVPPGPSNWNYKPLVKKKILEKGTKNNAEHKPQKPIIKMKNSVNLIIQRSIGLYHRNRHLDFQSDIMEIKLRACLDKNGIRKKYMQGTCCMMPNKDYSRLLFCSEDYNPEPSASLEYWAWDGGWTLLNIPSNSSFCFLNSDPNYILVACTVTSTMVLSRMNHTRRRLTVKGRSPFCCSSALSEDSKYVASFGDGPYTVLISNVEAFFRSKAFHPQGGPGSTVKHLERDVLAQSFSYMPNLHFNGLRGGSILGLDIRRLNRNSVCCALHPSLCCNVQQIRPLRDEFSVLVGYRNPGETPKVNLWDIRFASRPVLEYRANCTECRCSNGLNFRFTVNVDKDEVILTSVFPDLRARFWSIKTGELVKVYPDLDDNSKSVTAAAFTRDWTILDGRTGVWVCGDHKSEYFDFVT